MACRYRIVANGVFLCFLYRSNNNKNNNNDTRLSDNETLYWTFRNELQLKEKRDNCVVMKQSYY